MAMTVIPTHDLRPSSPASMLHASNLLTYLSQVVGLAAVVAALWYGNRAVAGAGIAFITVLDTFDGRFARRFNRTTAEKDFGLQLDSLSDAVNSGIIPVVVTTALLRPATVADGALWVAAAFVYLLGVVTRLGFYNLTHEDGEVFIGLPAPVAALTVATLLLWPVAAATATIVLVGCGIAMLSSWRIARPKGLGLLLFVLWPTVVIAAQIYGSSPLGP